MHKQQEFVTVILFQRNGQCLIIITFSNLVYSPLSRKVLVTHGELVSYRLSVSRFAGLWPNGSLPQYGAGVATKDFTTNFLANCGEFLPYNGCSTRNVIS